MDDHASVRNCIISLDCDSVGQRLNANLFACEHVLSLAGRGHGGLGAGEGLDHERRRVRRLLADGPAHELAVLRREVQLAGAAVGPLDDVPASTGGRRGEVSEPVILPDQLPAQLVEARDPTDDRQLRAGQVVEQLGDVIGRLAERHVLGRDGQDVAQCERAGGGVGHEIPLVGTSAGLPLSIFSISP